MAAVTTRYSSEQLREGHLGNSVIGNILQNRPRGHPRGDITDTVLSCALGQQNRPGLGGGREVDAADRPRAELGTTHAHRLRVATETERLARAIGCATPARKGNPERWIVPARKFRDNDSRMGTALSRPAQMGVPPLSALS